MRLPSFLTTPPPPVALHVGARGVSALAVLRARGGPVVTAHAVEPLRAGAVTPALTGQNLVDRAAVGRALSGVLGRLGERPRRVALVLPDAVAKVSLVKLASVPPGARDREQLIRWHVRKSAPFPLEEAQVAWSPGASLPEGGREFVVALARRAVVREYESLCEEAGAHAGWVDLAAFGLVNAVLAAARSAQGDWLVVHANPGSDSLAILRDGDLIFFRTRVEGGDDTLAALVHQTAMYHEDRLGGRGFARVLVAGAGDAAGPGGAEGVRQVVEARLGTRAEAVDPRRIVRFADRVDAGAAALEAVTPLLGAAVATSAGW
jgi:Tfp pilus assembly PilM family ATPase